jgi:hypothetical protein
MTLRVKLRKPHAEQMFSAVPAMADIAGCDRGTPFKIIEKRSAIRKMTGYGTREGGASGLPGPGLGSPAFAEQLVLTL